MSVKSRLYPVVVALIASSLLARAGAALALVENRSIGYVLTDSHWALYQSKNAKTECPDGFNDGPREQFKILFPDDGKKRTLLETQLSREAAIWHPDLSAEPFVFKAATGSTGIGMNLDGKIGPNDFTSPSGDVRGIDNQLYHVLGCISNYRGPDGAFYVTNNKSMQLIDYNRILIELTNVDSLTDDSDVTMTIYRGRGDLLTDATGMNFLPGGTQREDIRWGKQFVSRYKGRIVDGILTVGGADLFIPASYGFEDVTFHWVRDARFQLNLTQDRAEGLMAGYVDIDAFYRQLVRACSTHHQSYGQESAPSVFRALHRFADAYPDANGANSAISSAMDMKFVQAFIVHSPDYTTSR